MLELRSVKINERMSEETTCFSATLYFNGKKVGEASNRGFGGNTDVYIDPKFKSEVDKFKSTLPKEKFLCSLESLVDDLLNKHIEQKDHQKMMKKENTHILLKRPNQYGYQLATIKLKDPISEILKFKNGLEYLQKIVERETKNGWEILNTNIK